MKNFNLDYLRAFVTVIQQGSFSAAAEHLGLTQPAVSLQVRQLEKRLGTPLIERVGRKARPTVAGADLLAHVGGIEAAVSSAIDAVKRHGNGAVGRVRIGTGATACIFLLPPILGELRRRLPALEIIVTTGNTPDIVKAVEANTIDIALVTMPAAGRSLEIIPVMHDEFVAIAPTAISLPTRVTAANLAKLPLLLFEPGGNTRRIIDKWFAASHVMTVPTMSLGSVEAIKAMVGAGLGCSILPKTAVSSRNERDLVIRPLSPRLHRQLAVVVRRDKRLVPGLKATFDALTRVGKTRSLGR